jgi:hypothetical protein
MFKRVFAYKKDILAIIFLCLCSFIFLNKLFLESQIFTSQDIGQGDITHNSYPILDSYAQSLRVMKIPLWTNSISTGFPIFAENATFFLFNIVAYFLFPTYFAFNLSYLIVFITASIGTYFYCRYLGLTRFSSLFASITYAFSFFFVGHILHIAVLQAISLFPWLILIADKYFSKGSRWCLILFVVVFSEQFLTGFIQCVAYSITAIYIVMFIRYLRKPHFAKKIFILTFACLLAIGLAGMQILPTYELYAQSTRNVSLADNSRFFYTYKDLIYFVNPYFWGDPSKATYIRNPVEGLFWENNIYSGIIPFIFLIIGFLYSKKKTTIRPYVYLFFLSLIFSLGWFFFLKYIPPFSLFRLPQRALFLTSFTYAIIAGFGFEQIFSFVKKKISNNFLIIFVCIIIAVAFLDLFLNGQGYNGGISRDKWLEVPETAKYLQDQKISGRILSLGGTDWFNVYNNISHGWRTDNAEKLLSTRAVLSPDTNMLYGIASVNGYTAYRTLDSVLFNQIMLSDSSEDKKAIKLGSSSAKLLGLENVQYVVSTKDISFNPNDFELVWQKTNGDTNSTYRIYRNKQFIENIYSVKKIIVEISTQQMIDDLLSPNFTPKDTALIYNLNTTLNFPDEVSITDIRSDNDRITFHTNSVGNSFVVISNSYYPGWKAFIDNQEVDILEVNINSQGLQIKPGKHNVKLSYDPTSYRVGKFFTIMSWLIVIIIIFWPMVRKIIASRKLGN